MDRQEIIEKLKQCKWVPGHGPNIEDMTVEQLEKRLMIIESIFEDD